MGKRNVMWRCKKCETWNEDYYDSCLICHLEKNNSRPKKEPRPEPPVEPPSSSSFKVLKILVITIVVLLAVFGLLSIVLLAMNLRTSAVAFHFENQIQGGVEYVLQPMREIFAGWQQ